MTDSPQFSFEKPLLLAWLGFSLLLGALTVHQYGMSVDEPNNYRYAADTLKAFPSFFGLLYEPYYDSSYDGHGPAFVALAAIPIRMIQALFPNVFVPDLWHYSYYVTFLLTGLCLYWLARRWFSVWTAWGLLLVFSTQPLLLGHAFINPKDIPFMFFLTLSVLWGFQMVDAFYPGRADISLARPAQTITAKFKSVDPSRRKKFLILLAVAVAAGLALFLFSQTAIEHMVMFFYNAEPDSWAARIFSSVASRTVPAQDYVAKALRLFGRLERGLLIAGLIFFLAYFALLLRGATVSMFLKELWAQRHKLRDGFNPVRGDALQTVFAEILRAIRSSHLLLAGLALGLATGVRAIGPVAGVIVLLYLFAKVRSKAWAPAIAYFLVAGIVTYIVWPRLWDAPIPRYLEGLGLVSNFPHFPGRVLFNGKLYGPQDLPRSYLPVLLSIQLTEPAILCIYVGVGLLLWSLLRSRVPIDLLIYISLGFALPLFALILLNSTLYHNFRQTLFLVPAMFMLAAFTLELAFRKINQTWIRFLLIAAVVVPGISSTVKLYPYQYVYYNSLVGGPAGATYRFELDYWRISLREMALELNKVAPPESLIVVTRSAGLLARYTRPDLVVDKPINSILDLAHGYDYIVQVTRGKGGDIYPEVKNLIVIEREGMVLVTAKYVRDVSGR